MRIAENGTSSRCHTVRAYCAMVAWCGTGSANGYSFIYLARVCGGNSNKGTKMGFVCWILLLLDSPQCFDHDCRVLASLAASVIYRMGLACYSKTITLINVLPFLLCLCFFIMLCCNYLEHAYDHVRCNTGIFMRLLFQNHTFFALLSGLDTISPQITHSHSFCFKNVRQTMILCSGGYQQKW